MRLGQNKRAEKKRCIIEKGRKKEKKRQREKERTKRIKKKKRQELLFPIKSLWRLHLSSKIFSTIKSLISH